MEKKKTKVSKKLRIIPLGGLHEIGKNMTALEYGDDIIIIDCGMAFPGTEMLGIDAVIPDFTYIIENSSKVKGLFITHAHEDHIGAVPYLLKALNIPIYGSRLTLGFIKHKLKEHKITSAKLNEIQPGQVIKCGCFKVEAIHTNHSVADSFAFAIYTPVGTLFHTGDFKIDYTPVDGEPINLARIAKIGEEGVLLLMADSTNAMRKGYTPSEKNVGISLSNIFKNTPQRIIIATFSSNVDRVQKIIDLAVENKRKIAISGRSMENMVAIASELGYLKIPANTIVNLKEVKNIPDKNLIIITTGTQGEPMAALSRMAYGEHRNVHIRPKDVVILSSNPVPGNEKDVSGIVNLLMEQGATVIYNDIAETHVSGHACEEELKLLHTLLRPKFFMPVHGEVRHLLSHAAIAENLGMPEKNIIHAVNGQVVEATRAKVKPTQETVPADAILIDGLGIGDVGTSVLNERRVLSESGLIVLAAAFDSSGQIVSGPELYTKGLIYVKEYGMLLEAAKDLLNSKISYAYEDGRSKEAIKKMMVDTLRSYIYDKINRSPVIVPVFMEV